MTKRVFCSSVYCCNAGKILLVLHNKYKQWFPVGGKREGDETPLETARRELWEETGIDDPIFLPATTSEAPVGFFGYTEHLTPWGDLHMVHMFLAKVATTEIKPDKSFADWNWFDPEEVAQMADTVDSVRWAGRHILMRGL